mgnify:CR=1 FL=1|jgi:phospholipid/cholesterol/gamma-HCH transport system substrate-binding protein
MVFFYGNLAELLHSRMELVVQFPAGTSGGLNPGSDVRVAGHTVGVVTSVGINENQQVELLIQMDDTIAIKTNSKATVKTIGILGGEKYLNITPGTPEAPLLKAQDIIIGEEGIAVEELLFTVSDIAKNTQRITASVDRFLSSDEEPGEFLVTLDKAQELLDRVNRTITDVDRMLNTNEKSIRAMVDQVTHITGQVNEILVDNRGKIDTTFTNLQKVSLELPEVLGGIRGVLVDIRTVASRLKGGEGTAGRLIKDDELYLRIQRLIDDTDILIKHVKKEGIRIKVF